MEPNFTFRQRDNTNSPPEPQNKFDTPQQISDILSAIVTLDSQEPKTGTKKRLESVMDFACGSGSLLLNVRKKVNKAGGTFGKIFGQRRTSPPTTWPA